MDNEEKENENVKLNDEEPKIEIVEDDIQKGPTVEELQDKIMRNMAEFDNYRKRTIKEMATTYDRGVRDTVEKILPIVDNMERATKNLNVEDELAKGVVMIYKQLEAFLDAVGLKRIQCVGELFNATYHNAVQTVQDEDYTQGTIIEEFVPGYTYNDIVVRHSVVKVNS